jgi:hypothetical protein
VLGEHGDAILKRARQTRKIRTPEHALRSERGVHPLKLGVPEP